MRQASNEYKEEMKFPFRNQWLLEMYLGLIRERFQATAFINPLNNILFSNVEHMFDNTSVSTAATFEKDVFKADGQSTFFDKESTEFYGLVSDVLSDNSGNIDFSFSITSKTGEKGLKGLTLQFKEVYPTAFTVEVKSNGSTMILQSYTNDSMKFTTTDDFGENADELIIYITKMNKPNVRFRLANILLGVGVSFDNSQFLSQGGVTSFMHGRSVELPTQELNINLENYDDKYNFDRDDSIINLTEKGQDVTFQIKYTKDDGSIEPVYSANFEIDSFNVDGKKLTIKGVDFLRNENTKVVFDDPDFFTPTTTLYDVAQKLIERVVNETFEVVLDDSLKDVPCSFTHVETSVKQGLMMIASAGRCIMDLKDKTLVIRREETSHADITVTSDSATSFSDLRVSDHESVTRFASFEKNKVNSVNEYLFPSDVVNTSYKTGFVSQEISGNDGVFINPPMFSLNLSESIAPTFFSIQFEDCIPESITISTYYQGSLKETLDYSNLREPLFELLYDFKAFDRMDISINSIHEGNRRVCISYAGFDKNVYEMTKDLYMNTIPRAELADTVRNIIVSYQNSVKDQDGNITDNKQTIIVPCNTSGADIAYDNPFITSSEVATDVGEWLRTYYTTHVSYDFEHVGDPTLEVNDAISIYSDYSEDVICDIEENETRFSNGGIRGKIKARRRENVDRTQNQLAA